ncbi:MAG: hypothetical protein U5K76_06465 [Woeseiaceae bacterium]|nr:hypothetical protein [Woeseiaceae bacterium]
MSNEPVRSYDDLKGKEVWLPEGDLIQLRGHGSPWQLVRPSSHCQ